VINHSGGLLVVLDFPIPALRTTKSELLMAAGVLSSCGLASPTPKKSVWLSGGRVWRSNGCPNPSANVLSMYFCSDCWLWHWFCYNVSTLCSSGDLQDICQADTWGALHFGLVIVAWLLNFGVNQACYSKENRVSLQAL